MHVVACTVWEWRRWNDGLLFKCTRSERTHYECERVFAMLLHECVSLCVCARASAVSIHCTCTQNSPWVVSVDSARRCMCRGAVEYAGRVCVCVWVFTMWIVWNGWVLEYAHRCQSNTRIALTLTHISTSARADTMYDSTHTVPSPLLACARRINLYTHQVYDVNA